jgi:hypothetical protein
MQVNDRDNKTIQSDDLVLDYSSLLNVIVRMQAQQAALRERSTLAVAEQLVDDVVAQECLEVAAYVYW